MPSTGAQLTPPPQDATTRLLIRLIRWQAAPVIGPLCRLVLRWRGTDIPPHVLTAGDPLLGHTASNVVIHAATRLGSRVVIMQGVTIGRSDPWVEYNHHDNTGVIVEDDAFLGAGAAVIFKSGEVLTIGRGSVIGANALLTRSIGPWEIWAGNPARRVGTRIHD